MGSLVVGQIEDETGWVYVSRPPACSSYHRARARAVGLGRVVGRWDHEKLEEGENAIWGIHAQQVELIDR